MDKPHYAGHRKRLRERFRKTGFEGFQDYEAMELMLTYALHRKDVKRLAKALIEKFGSVQGVLDAPFEELSAIPGLTENSATFVMAMKEVAALYLRKRAKGGKGMVISSAGALVD